MIEAPALTATYRLQLNKDFTLQHARAIVPYLSRLGISHIYSSPVLRSRPGSPHGYDVVDPTRLDPELGSDADWDALVRTLREHGMGLVLDIVPNHMGVGADNPFWDDLFANGPASRYARWFDIDWSALQRGVRGRVLIPILGDELDAVIARGEIRLTFEYGRLRVRYFDNSLPVDPATIPRILTPALETLRTERGAGDPDVRELAAVDETLLALPPRLTASPARVEERRHAAPEALRRLEALYERSAAARAAVDAAVRHFVEGPAGRARLRTLLDSQVYSLVYWRRAAHEINYRRFFDINELVALRMEDPEVFGSTHRRIIQWVKDAQLDGLRIDHIDGLLDPLDYLRRLRAVVTRVREAGGGTRDSQRLVGVRPPSPDAVPSPPARKRAPARVPSPDPFPILVEKILSPGEHLRAEWPVQGTTGYEFLNDLEGIFVDPAGAAAIERVYRELLGIRRRAIGFAEVAYRGKLLILRSSLAADVQRLGRLLAPIAKRASRTASCTRAQLNEGIVQLIACLPVYRTYIDARSERVHPDDRRVIETAIRRVRDRAAAPAAVVDLLAEVLLLERCDELSAAEHQERLRFIQRFQQTSGPAMAKGAEDTALYRYIPLLSLNEVGSEPDRPLAEAVDRLHRANAERAERWPRGLICTTTHDTKRSADVRSRLDVLSEIPDAWAERVARWRREHRGLRARVRGRHVPDPNTEYLLYQTLVGMWPLARDGALPDEAERAAVRERLEGYMLKAVREAKARTSWTDPDPDFEGALTAFVRALFGRASAFLADLNRFVAQLARPGIWNALARALIHCAAPGTADVYQGDELWNFALVDPDNRRPVDFARRDRLLGDLERVGGEAREAYVRELVDSAEDGRIKLHVIRSAFRARRSHLALFAHGTYEPLHAAGSRGEHAFAFLRRHEGAAAIAVAPRLTRALSDDGRPPVGSRVWGEAALRLPAELGTAVWRCAVQGHVVEAELTSGAPALRLASILRTAPVALLLSGGPAATGAGDGSSES